jgi:hypothetical protein
LLFSGVHGSFAGVLNGYKTPKPTDYYDYGYAAHVWGNLTTREELEAEEGKFIGSFDEWISLYISKDGSARRKKGEYEGQESFRRRYDIQLAYDEWRDRIYNHWWSAYHGGSAKVDFDQWLREMNAARINANCSSRKTLYTCGPAPDWRSEEDKQAEQAMMAQADRQFGRK